MITIYHNNRCRKSREALALLQESGQEFQVREYLKAPPSKEELQQLLKKLDLAPQDIIRKGEAVYKEHYKGKNLSDDQWIQIMADHPILIERPIVIKGQRAVVGRPTENINRLL